MARKVALVRTGQTERTERTVHGVADAQLAEVHALIEREFVPTRSPSVVLAVARSDGPASVRGFGLAQWDPEEVAADAATVYALASITKPFVALAAIHLAGRGGLGLDDAVATHIPEFAHAARDATTSSYDRAGVTVRHLLAHTAGLAHVDEQWHANPKIVRCWDTLAQTACAAPLLFAPGTKFLYSGTNYTVLAEVIRRRSGLRIDAYLREHVFAPLGMADTGFFPYSDPSLRGRIAQVANYRWPEDRVPRDNANKFFPPESMVPNPGGGLRSSARDLVAFGQTCLRLLRGTDADGAPFTRASLESMLRNQTEALPAHDTRKGPMAPPKGLGWDLPGRDPAERAFWSPTAFGHAGSSGTLLQIDPGQDLLVAVLGSRVNSMKGKRALAQAAVQAARGQSGVS